MRVVFIHGPAASGKHTIGKLTDRALFEEIERKHGFEFPPLPEPLVRIDTATLSAEQAADRIATALR